jgi:hypothetical protein
VFFAEATPTVGEHAVEQLDSRGRVAQLTDEIGDPVTGPEGVGMIGTEPGDALLLDVPPVGYRRG